MDGIIVFSGFMLAVYRKGRFQLSITKLNQQTASKKKGRKGRKGKGKRVALVGSTEGKMNTKYKNTRLAPKSLVPLAAHTHPPPLHHQKNGQKLK